MNPLTVLLLAGTSAVLLMGLLGVTRAVVHEQRARRDQPRNRIDERVYRHRSRREKVKVVGSLLFGRWAEDGHRDGARKD